MRATISFEAEVDRVNDVMLALSKQETDSIRSSAHVIETAKHIPAFFCFSKTLV